MRRFLLPFIMCALGLLPAPSAEAEILAGMGGGDAVRLEADQLDIDVLAGEATLTGKVTLAKGSLTITCPRIDLRFDHAPHVTWARGSGGVAADVQGVHAEAPSVEIDLSRQLVELSGGVKLTRGQGWLTADRARIDIATAKVSLTQVKGGIPVARGSIDFVMEGSQLPADAALAASGLRITRGGRRLIDGIDLQVAAGEVLGVLGPSGAGKSTLFRALTGEAPADEGRVALEGRDVTRWPLWKRARAGIGYVPQGPSVLWDLTVTQNLDAYRVVAGLAPRDPRLAATEVGLEDRLHVRAVHLSAGERRRLEVARALTRAPRVIVCDEPFAGVDPAGATRLGDLLRSLAERGAAVLLADHHVAAALRVCSRAILLLEGSVAGAAPASEFADLPLVRARYLQP